MASNTQNITGLASGSKTLYRFNDATAGYDEIGEYYISPTSFAVPAYSTITNLTISGSIEGYCSDGGGNLTAASSALKDITTSNINNYLLMCRYNSSDQYWSYTPQGININTLNSNVDVDNLHLILDASTILDTFDDATEEITGIYFSIQIVMTYEINEQTVTISNILSSTNYSTTEIIVDKISKLKFGLGTTSQTVSGTTGRIKDEDGYYIAGGSLNIGTNKGEVTISGSRNYCRYNSSTGIVYYTLRSVRSGITIRATISYDDTTSNKTVSNLYLGSSEVSKIYLGEGLVYQKGVPSYIRSL